MDETARARLESEVRALCERGDYAAGATAALRGYGPEIYGFLVAVRRDETSADEAFSDFAEGLWRALPSFAWSSTLRTWAYAIARNVTRAARRAAARQDRRHAGPSALDHVAHVVRTETRTLLKTQKRSRLEALRDALPPDDRALLVLRVDRGLAWNELAAVLAEGELDAADVAREAARLRKRFQLVKERLRELARREGLV
jgi:RNA polymerase sigma-70 factor (ECF subfamily)